MTSAQTQPERHSIYFCFGDSITANGGWIRQLKDEKVGHFINAGRSGRKACDLPREFPPAWQECSGADQLILFLGINDLPSRDPRNPQTRVKEALDGVQMAIEFALASIPSPHIHLFTPAGLFPEGMSEVNQAKGYPDAQPLLDHYEQGLRQLALQYGVKYLSLAGSLKKGDFRDGLHPNASGESMIAGLVKAHLLKPTVYCVGDSISIDYHQALGESLLNTFHYSRKSGLAQARKNLDQAQGANGGDSSMVLAHLREYMQSPDPADYLVINCGLHDIKRARHAEAARQVESERYRENLEAIIRTVHGAGRKMVWVNTTPVDESIHRQFQKHFYRRETDWREYQGLAAEVMEAANVPIIDLAAFTQNLGEDLYRDHVHFHPAISVAQGHFLAAELKRILPQIKDLKP